MSVGRPTEDSFTPQEYEEWINFCVDALHSRITRGNQLSPCTVSLLRGCTEFELLVAVSRTVHVRSGQEGRNTSK